MNKNLQSSKIKKNKTRDEFYTPEKTAIQFVSPLGDAGAYAKKHIFCNCDGPESEIYKLLKKNFQKWDLASLEACQYNKDGFGKHTLYSNEKDEDIVEMLPDNGSFDSPSSLEILGRSDLVITNPPFSKQDYFIKMLMDLDKKFSIICNMIGLKSDLTIRYAINGELKIICSYNGGGVFTRQNGEEVRVQVVAISNLDNIDNSCWVPHRLPIMTKQQLLDKGVLYHPDGYPDNHFEVRYLKNIPTDLGKDEVVWCPMTVLLNQWYAQRYELCRDLFDKHKGHIRVDGKARFYRVPMKVKDQQLIANEV